MFISRKRLEKLEKQVTKLQAQLTYQYLVEFEVDKAAREYYNANPSYMPWQCQEANLKDIVCALINHLDLKVEFIGGVPPYHKMVKNK